MIGKIMSEVSHSIVGMLSAKPVNMDTQASNFDFSTLLSSPDDQYRSVLGGVGAGKLEEVDGQRFVDALAGNEGQVNSTKLPLDLEAESKPVEAPVSFLDTEDAPQPGNISETLSLAEQIGFSSVAMKPEAIRSSTDFEGDQPEPIVPKDAQAIDAPLSDNEKPKTSHDQAGEILVDRVAKVDNFVPVVPAANLMRADNSLVSHSTQDGSKTLDVLSNRVPVETPSVIAGATITSSLSQPVGFKQDTVLPGTNPLNGSPVTSQDIGAEIEGTGPNAKNISVQVAPGRTAPDVPVEPVQRHVNAEAVRIFPAGADQSNEAPINAPNVQTAKQDNDSLGLREIMQNQVSDNRGKVDLPISSVGNRPQAPAEKAVLKANLIKRTPIEPSPKPIASNQIDISAEDLTRSPGENVRLAWKQNEKVVSEVPAERASLNVRENVVRTPRQNVEQGYAPLAISDVGEPKQNSKILSPIDLRSLSGTDKAVVESQTKPESLRTLENLSRLERGQAPRTGDLNPDSPPERSVQKSRIVDSIDLRLANKVETRPAITRSSPELDLPDVPVEVEKTTKADFTMPVKNSDVTETATPVNPVVNAAVQPATQRTVSFDWNAPKFAERFAAEINGLSVDGDTKKFEINPRNLGRLEVAFVSRGTTEFIRIEAESDAAREVIVQNSQAIQDMLKAQGRSDLAIRVDVRENTATSANSGSLNLAQHENASTNDDHPNAPQNQTQKHQQTTAAESHIEPETENDGGRYA